MFNKEKILEMIEDIEYYAYNIDDSNATNILQVIVKIKEELDKIEITNNQLNYKDLNIDNIYLLSIEETEKLPEYVRAYDDWWWLRSPGFSQNYAAGVLDDGSVYFDGYYVFSDYFCVRPALHISNLNISNLELYGDIIIDGVKFIYIGNNDILYNDKSVNHRFDENTNDYDKSEIKKFVENEFLSIVFEN